MSAQGEVTAVAPLPALRATPETRVDTVTAAFKAERIEGAEAVVAAIAAARPVTSGLAFQRGEWLDALLQTLAKAENATPLVVRVTDAATGDLVLILPLIATRERGLSVVAIPSLGVSDYGAPLLGPSAPQTAEAAKALMLAVKGALTGYDLLRLDNMPSEIVGRKNPLALLPGLTRARHSANRVILDDTVEALLRARGKKYRKEAERCYRLLAERGEPSFRRAKSDDEIAHAYCVLQEQQAARHAEAGGSYVLDKPAYAKFYDTVVRKGCDSGFASLFTLSAGGETGATLFGITEGDTFTLLRISTAGGDWKRLSPGRLIVLETMRTLSAQGIRRFDMGIGDYAFKHGFGIEAEPLYDLAVPLSLRAIPAARYGRLKARLRQNPRLKALVASLKRKG